MVSVHCSASPFQVVLGFHRPVHRPQTSFITFHGPRRDAFPRHFNFRFNNDMSVHLRQRLLPISTSSSNNNPSGRSDKSNDASGPPLTTILAGILVFCVVCWIVGSIVMWLISVITNVPPSK